jgi:hypothetical protein
VTHLVHAPSNPLGWTAGKWMEWYPDVLNADGKLTTAEAKPYWQSGWLKQHDRLVAAMGAMKGRIPLTVSGDLHAIGIGTILRAGTLNLERTPTAVLAGPIGTRATGWPSAFRGIGSTPPAYLDVREEIKPIEQHSFTMADFLPDRIILRFFKWDLTMEVRRGEELDVSCALTCLADRDSFCSGAGQTPFCAGRLLSALALAASRAGLPVD